jgi:hypothetical protein
VALERPQISGPDGDIPFDLGVEDLAVGTATSCSSFLRKKNQI